MVTKRQLGFLFVLIAVVVVGGTVGVDLLGAGEWSGFGPLQWLGLAAGSTLLAVGLILVRIGNRPA